ncbi:hypothetical protein BKA64DRAFT_685673 [Cadophora sp. MPI-SDFR-AT-0126]|nr:hypothetical protein BKA64DRAFT_685673 [Leotiomycetes sp. MPI-SDFR-AT-0126]
MGAFNNSSRSSQKLWDPTTTLGIINTDPGYERITCVGYAPSQGRRCRMAINQWNRQSITKTLDDISYLQPDDPVVLSRLKTMAGEALCVRFHQGQASDILSQWRRKLPKVQRINSGTKKRTTREDGRNQTMKDLQEQLRKLRELMEEVEEKMQGQQSESSSGEESEEANSEEDSIDFTSDEESEEEEDFSSTRNRRKDQESARKERERLERERLDRERAEATRERIRRQAQEKADKARAERERKEKEEEEAREAEAERKRRQQARERAAKAARERQEREEQEKARLERERAEKERKEKEEAKKKRDAENAASNERIRQRARERAEKAEREKREQEEKEQAEWDQAWVKYQDKWTKFRASRSGDGGLREAIPWPVKSELLQDVCASNVKTFLDKSLPKGADRSKLLRKECQKWHPDSVCRWTRASEMTAAYRMSTDMICRVVTDILNVSSGRSSEFL